MSVIRQATGCLKEVYVNFSGEGGGLKRRPECVGRVLNFPKYTDLIWLIVFVLGRVFTHSL
jgi:hypothetical protein